MKKISIFVSVLTIFCFLTAGSAVAADPPCGVYLLSVGTSYNTLSPAFTTIPGMCQQANDKCTMWDGGIAWSLTTCPDSCQQFTTMLPFEHVFANIKGGAAQLALKVNMKYKQENSSGFGTLTFADWRNVPGPPNPIPRWHARIIKSESDVGLYFSNYVTTQSSTCDVDFGAYPTSNFPADSEFVNTLTCEIVSGDLGGNPLPAPSEYTLAKFRYYGTSGTGFPTPVGTIGYQVAAPVRKAFVEILKPLRGDLDGNGVMTGADYGIFAADWSTGTAMCVCPTYWP
jgi:hypothetical protein